MKDFDQILEDSIGAYEGRYDHLIHLAPSFYRLMTHLLDDPNLPGRLRPLVVSAIAYFILPADIMPEDLQGPFGYVDDIFLSAFIANRIRQELSSGEILVNNWDGNLPILSVMDEILAEEEALVGDKRDLILWYIGYEYMIPKS